MTEFDQVELLIIERLASLQAPKTEGMAQATGHPADVEYAARLRALAAKALTAAREAPTIPG